MNKLTKDELIGAEVKGLGTIIDIMGTPGESCCKYKVDIIEGHPARTHHDGDWICQIVIDMYNI